MMRLSMSSVMPVIMDSATAVSVNQSAMIARASMECSIRPTSSIATIVPMPRGAMIMPV